MAQDILTLYKLIVLYMLDQVNFPLTQAQISDFMLGKEYTNFLTLQQVFTELTNTGMIYANTIRNRTHLSITSEGKETLRFFENRINEPIKEDIAKYLKENEFELRDETSVLSNYYQTAAGDYEARLTAKDRDITLIDLTLSVPTEKMAETICDNWQKKNQTIYQYLTRELF